jgi:uncharacterized protein YbaR (Trm112 family)
MTLNKDLLDILACPKCKGEVTLLEKQDGLRCDTCKVVYPVRDEIPVMLIEGGRAPGPVAGPGRIARAARAPRGAGKRIGAAPCLGRPRFLFCIVCAARGPGSGAFARQPEVGHRRRELPADEQQRDGR